MNSSEFQIQIRIENIIIIFYGITIVYESSRRNYAVHESQRRYRIRDIAWIVNVHNDDGQTDGGIGHR